MTQNHDRQTDKVITLSSGVLIFIWELVHWFYGPKFHIIAPLTSYRDTKFVTRKLMIYLPE